MYRLLKKINNKNPIHPTFFLFFLWFIFNQQLVNFLFFILVMLSHEFGHYWVAKKCGYRLNSFYIAPYGVNLNYKEKSFESKDEVCIAVAGPFVNIFLSLVIISIWWIFPAIYNYTNVIVEQSLVLGLFNLLPCYPLDGGRILIGILSQKIERRKAVKISYVFNFLFSFILFVLFLISCFTNFNPTLCLCAVFLFLGTIDSKKETKYQSIFFVNRKVKNFSKSCLISVNDDVSLSQLLNHIEINKYTIFTIISPKYKTKYLDENTLRLLLIKYPPNTKLKDLIK